MRAWAIGLAIIVCAALGAVWFRRVRRILLERRDMLDHAQAQLTDCRKRAAGARCDPALAEVLARSESIYRQAVYLYNAALDKPWIYLPGRLMGFCEKNAEDLP